MKPTLSSMEKEFELTVEKIRSDVSPGFFELDNLIGELITLPMGCLPHGKIVDISKLRDDLRNSHAEFLVASTTFLEAPTTAADAAESYLRTFNNCRSRFLAIRSSPSLFRPIGNRLLTLAGFIYSRKKYERIFVPAVSDMRDEYFEALSKQELWKSRWIRVRGTWSIFAAAFTDVPLSIIGLVVKLWAAAK